MADLKNYERSESERKHRETICDIHRDMWKLVKESRNLSEIEKQLLQGKLETAFKMGKSMDAKLRQYKGNYSDSWWSKEKRAWDWEELKGS